MCPDVFAVIATFNPKLPALDLLVRHLLPQVGGAIIVDNGSEVEVSEWHRQCQCDRLQLHLIGQNLGIAAAQNIGLAQARHHSARFVLLFDQDSQPAADMVLRLRESLHALEIRGTKVAAVGPRYFDARHDGRPARFEMKSLCRGRRTDPSCKSVVEVDYLISSGSLISMDVVEVVGGMREDLFIDYVDIEWALRTRQHGYKCYGVSAAMMTHRLGDSSIAFMGRRYPLHSPLRHYYRFRNAAWLYKQRYVPLHWKVADGIQMALKYLFYSFLAKPQFSYCRMMTLGIIHGIRSRLGKLP